MTTVNLNLSKNTEKLFQDLEKNTGVKKDEFIADLVSGKDNLEDLKLLNNLLKKKKANPNPRRYSYEEGKKILGF